MPALEFNLYGNAYREGAAFAPVSRSYRAKAYYNGDSYGNMEIAEVSPCAAWEVCGQDENILRVELEKPVPPGGEAALTIRYTLTLAEVEHRTGIARHAVNLGNFYPVLCVYEPEIGFYECEYYSHGDPFYSECADYFVEFTAGAEYVVAASGAVSAATAAGSKKTLDLFKRTEFRQLYRALYKRRVLSRAGCAREELTESSLNFAVREGYLTRMTTADGAYYQASPKLLEAVGKQSVQHYLQTRHLPRLRPGFAESQVTRGLLRQVDGVETVLGWLFDEERLADWSAGPGLRCERRGAL